MRAYVLKGPNSASISELPRPRISPEEVIVRMKVLSICETDWKVFSGSAKPKKMPIILGHEGGGFVEEVGSNVRELVERDRVLVDPNVYDYMCPQCMMGRYQLCDNGGLMGRDEDGLFAEMIKTSPTRLYRLPETIKDDVVPLLQPLSTVIHASKRVDVLPGDVVVVIGLGPTGLLLSRVAKSRGALVIGTSRSQMKLEVSRVFGVDYAINATNQDIRAEVKTITGGQGSDVVIEAVGDPELSRLCFDLAKKGGRILQFGISNSYASYNMHTMYEKEMSLMGTRSSVPTDFLEAIDFVASGRIDLEPLLTARFRFEEMDEAVKASTMKSRNLKVVVAL